GLGPGAWGLGPGAWGLGPGAWGLGPGAWGLGPGAWGLGPGAGGLGPGAWAYAKARTTRPRPVGPRRYRYSLSSQMPRRASLGQSDHRNVIKGVEPCTK